jgi:LacI family transcriptional regulator
MRVPDDIALVGYDDIDFARSAVIPLTSIAQPTAALGDTAVDLLVNAPNRTEARNIVFEPKLIVRSSTVPNQPNLSKWEST